jgi:hypothetical protein
MRKFIFPSILGTVLLWMGCIHMPTAPVRQDPFAGIDMRKTPAYPHLSVALILTENAKKSMEYGQWGSQQAGFDFNQAMEQEIDLYRSNFKSVVKIEKMADAQIAGTDLIVILDTFIEGGLSLKLEKTLIFLDPDQKEIDRVHAIYEHGMSITKGPAGAIAAVLSEIRRQLEDGLRASVKLREYAKSKAPTAAVATVASTPGNRSAADRPTAASNQIVAIFDIHDASKKLDQDVLIQLTTYLGTLLTKTGMYKVIPREQIRSRLLDEKKGTYEKCFDESCQIELGKALSAQKSLATTMIQVGNQCAVTANLFDLKTETSEKGASVETGCSSNELLGAIKEIAKQLSE